MNPVLKIEKLKIVFLICFSILYLSSLFASNSDSIIKYLPSVNKVDSQQNNYSANISLLFFSRSSTEEEIQFMPFLILNSKFGLKNDYSIITHLRISYFYNEISLGLMKSYEFNNLSFGFSNSLAFWFGFLKDRGFNSSAYGFLTIPEIHLGTIVDKQYIGLKSDMLLLFGQKNIFNNEHITRYKLEIGSIGFALIMIQPLINKNSLEYQIKINYFDTKAHVWYNFPLSNKWEVYYEVFLGYRF